ncbi:MAG: putative bifunctional diguanylate cyclase/phosphodiesterase, partial [Sphingopyxis sp.]
TLLARLGGDEFAVLFAVPRDAGDTIDAVGEAMTVELAQPVMIDDIAASTSSSIGGAMATDAATTLDLLLRHADTAMYRAKKLGRCRYCRFDDGMGQALALRDVIERELRVAITRCELYPVYEPLIDLSTGQAIGYEMLARWTSPTLGAVSPGEFIPVAEEKGLISLLSDALFRQAFLDAAQWPASISLSINVSPLQLRDPWFAQKLLKLLAETRFPPQRLVVELTESAIVDNLPLAQAVFTSLKNQGIRMALDDFGTGYSSIASLRALPFDSVKIDREFVERMSETGDNQSIAAAVLQLGRSMGLPVVAEGIENSATAARLNDLACAVGQGHYYGKALSAHAVLAAHCPPADAAATPAAAPTAAPAISADQPAPTRRIA